MLKMRWAGWMLAFAVAGAPHVFSAESRARDPIPYLIDVWESDDGLPQSSVITLIQTRDGYLWMGTLAGLVRFDGLQFTVFDEGNTPGLQSSRIVHLFEDSRTNLWIGTATSGIFLAHQGVVTSLGLGAGDREAMLVSACEDKTGAVWLYTRDGQLWRYHEGEAHLVFSGEDFQEPPRSPMVMATDSGLVWVYMENRLVGLDSAGDFTDGSPPIKHVLPLLKLDYMLASRDGGYWRLADRRIQKWRENQLVQDIASFPWLAPVSSACEDQEGNLVVGTQGEGLFLFDANGEYVQLSAENGLSYNYILSLHADREGELWVGTDGGGLNRVKRRVFHVVEETLGWVVQSVAEDQDGGIWIASNGNGVGHWQAGQFRHYGPTNGLSNPNVRSVFVDRDNRVWAGTSGLFGVGMYQFHQDRFIPFFTKQSYHRAILAMHQTDDDVMWVGTQGGLVRWSQDRWRTVTTEQGLSANVIRAIHDDFEGGLWVGTDGGGLDYLAQDEVVVYNKANGFPADNIASFYLDADGVLWVGTYGGGLIRWRNGQAVRYATEDGLVSNTVGYLLEDDAAHLWIGSNAGLMRAPKSELNAFAEGKRSRIIGRVYRGSDGLPSRECTMGSQPGALKSSDGQLWFPTIKGLVHVDPSQLTRASRPPNVALETVMVDGQVQQTNRLNAGPPPSVTIPAGRERLEIRYTALNLSAPDQARFRYRLTGHESEWVEAGGSRVVRYSKLPPGRFEFQLTASNEEGIWNELGATLSVVVLPPFWRTTWFLTTSSAVLLCVIVGSVYYLSTQRLQRQLEVMRQQEALEKERARIARDLHDQLGASLTQVNMLSEMIESDKEDPEEVEWHARQISQTAVDTSRALDEIVWTVNPSNDTLEGLINYVCKYAQDYFSVAGLRYRLDVPDQLPDTVISPDLRHNMFLAAQEAITNIVKHAQATEAKLRLRMKDATFTLEIEDDGKGLATMDEEAARRRNGLSNMRKRMEDVGGSFTIKQVSPRGTRVSLTAPLARQTRKPSV